MTKKHIPNDITLLMWRIEGLDFNANLSLASGMNLFRIILKSNKSFRQLLHACVMDDNVHNLIVTRVRECLEDSGKVPNTLNQYDRAIGAYLYILHMVRSKYGRPDKDLRETIKSDRYCRWGRRVVEHIEEIYENEDNGEKENT